MGKSHLISFAALLLLSSNPEAKVYIMYSHSELMDKDYKLVDAIIQVSKAGKRLKKCLPKDNIKPRE